MLIDNVPAFRQAIAELKEESSFVIDVETDGLDPFGENEICGIGLSPCDGDKSYYFPIRHKQGDNLPMMCYQELIYFLSSVTELVGYNLKFDLHFLRKDNLQFNQYERLIDVIVMVRLTEPTVIKDLDLTSTLKRTYGEEAAQYDIDMKQHLRTNKWTKDFSLAPPDMLGAYCEQDVLWTKRLYRDREQLIKKSSQGEVWQSQIELTTVLMRMEDRGITIDTDYAQSTMERIEARKVSLAEEIFEITGEFNINSTKQLGEILNDHGIYSPILTPKGKQSWNEAALIRLNHPIAGLVRQYRTLEKLRSTYLEPNLSKKILHTSFCNWGTVTGRGSSRSPNLQNIPRNHFKLSNRSLSKDGLEDVRRRINAIVAAKGGEGVEDLDDEVLNTWGFIGDESFDAEDEAQLAIRRLFVPRPGYNLVSFDYSQMEVRIFLSYIKNDTIKELLHRDDVDFHGEAAKLAFHSEEDNDDFKFFRQMAKAVTFGTIYGIGNKKLSLQLGTTPKEAGQYKRQYFAGLKGSKEFVNSVARMVETRGWIKNRYGRVYHIPEQLAYKGVNYLVQGTSADILNERMVEVYKILWNTNSHLLLQVHDEVICEIPDNEMSTMIPLVRDCLKENSLGIPLQVDVEICAPSWATKMEFEAWTNDQTDDIIDYIDWDDIP